MPVDVSRLEIERVMNIITNFGWTLVKQETTVGDIVLVITKPILSETKVDGVGTWSMKSLE